MSLEELPVELLQAILKELCPRDLAVLSSISRPIYPVTMRELYTSITLKKREQSRLLAKSLKHRPAKASFVKYLLKSRRADSDAIKVLPDIVKHLDQLKHFEITADETSDTTYGLATDRRPRRFYCRQTPQLAGAPSFAKGPLRRQGPNTRIDEARGICWPKLVLQPTDR
ncbi:hypothetical protein BDN71DRAFT_1442284 [Pleurotus eryngii]|uniref:F-box domain-containing protein n=1 Tax=Pleurotus eryngii TaxID=5323 RepID=A0A9P6A432_PLEER|nr:hypothetical protein BDN71DRAFT_1442284 [Pleurotus eryngii]